MSDENDVFLPPGEDQTPVAPDLPVDSAAVASLLMSPEDKAALLAELQEAYFTGATRIKFRERDVSYRSRAEMKAIIKELEEEIFPRSRKKDVILTTFRRGY